MLWVRSIVIFKWSRLTVNWPVIMKCLVPFLTVDMLIGMTENEIEFMWNTKYKHALNLLYAISHFGENSFGYAYYTFVVNSVSPNWVDFCWFICLYFLFCFCVSYFALTRIFYQFHPHTYAHTQYCCCELNVIEKKTGGKKLDSTKVWKCDKETKSS